MDERKFTEWVASLDADEGARRRVSLTQIIDAAQAALDVGDAQRELLAGPTAGALELLRRRDVEVELVDDAQGDQRDASYLVTVRPGDELEAMRGRWHAEVAKLYAAELEIVSLRQRIEELQADAGR